MKYGILVSAKQLSETDLSEDHLGKKQSLSSRIHQQALQKMCSIDLRYSCLLTLLFHDLFCTDTILC